MTKNGDKRDFGNTRARKRIDRLFTNSGENQLKPDELNIARVAYDSRRSETLVPYPLGLLALAALALAIVTATGIGAWMGIGIGVVGAIAMFLTTPSASQAGEAAAAQAVVAHRQALLLAAQNAVLIPQPASPATYKPLAVIAVAVIAGAATIATAALLLRPQ